MDIRQPMGEMLQSILDEHYLLIQKMQRFRKFYPIAPISWQYFSKYEMDLVNAYEWNDRYIQDCLTALTQRKL